MRTDSDRLVGSASSAASLAIAAMLAITLAFVAWPRVADALGIEPAAPPPPYVTGGRIDTPAAWHSRTPVTLVLFARASCGACQRGKPFLASLVADIGTRADVVVVGGAAEDTEFARALGVPDANIRLAPAGLRVRVTPTLVLVDRDGTILHAWEGVGAPDKQAAISQAVRDALGRFAGPA